MKPKRVNKKQRNGALKVTTKIQIEDILVLIRLFKKKKSTLFQLFSMKEYAFFSEKDCLFKLELK